MSKQAYDFGFYKASKVGSCALVAVVINNKLYIANSGDCKGVLFRKDEQGLRAIELNRTLNANNVEEQQRLRREFKDDDIFVCKNNNPNACYVKVCDNSSREG